MIEVGITINSAIIFILGILVGIFLIVIYAFIEATKD